MFELHKRHYVTAWLFLAVLTTLLTGCSAKNKADPGVEIKWVAEKSEDGMIFKVGHRPCDFQPKSKIQLVAKVTKDGEPVDHFNINILQSPGLLGEKEFIGFGDSQMNFDAITGMYENGKYQPIRIATKTAEKRIMRFYFSFTKEPGSTTQTTLQFELPQPNDSK